MKPFPIFARRHAAVVATLILAYPLVGEAAGPRVRQVSARSQTSGYAVDAGAANELRPEDRAFLNKAAETVRQQLRLAEIGLSHSRSSNVRSHAQQLATDYRSLNQALEALVRRKGGIAGAPVGGTSETYRNLIAASGTEFDRAFVRTVSRLTDDLLTLFEQFTSDARDTDLREFAAAQLPVLRGHRSEATQLLKEYD